MNWVADITVLLTIAGFAGAFYMFYKNGPMSLWIPLAYFSLMGVLQSFSHTIANQCSLPANQVASQLAYLHYCFQPFFINALALHFIDKRVSCRIDLPVYTLCFTGMTLMLIQLYPFNWAGRCEAGGIMCGETICTMRDNSFLMVMVPFTQFMHNVPFYFITAILTPIIYGSWRFMVLYMLSCPILAYLSTQNMNEWAGLSSLFTIAFLLLVVAESRVRNILFIKRWLGWRLSAES